MSSFVILLVFICLIVAKEYFRSVMNKNKLQFFRDECNSVLLKKIQNLKELLDTKKLKLNDNNNTIRSLIKQVEMFDSIKNAKSEELNLLLANYNKIQQDFENLKQEILKKSQRNDEEAILFKEAKEDIEQLRFELSILEEKLSSSIQKLNQYNKNSQIMIRVVNEITVKKYNILTDLEDNILTQLNTIRSTNLNLSSLNSNLKDKLNNEIKSNLLEILKNLKNFKKQVFLKNIADEVNQLNLITIKISLLKLSFTKRIIELYQEQNSIKDTDNVVANKSLSSLKKSINLAYNQKLFEYESAESKLKI